MIRPVRHLTWKSLLFLLALWSVLSKTYDWYLDDFWGPELRTAFATGHVFVWTIPIFLALVIADRFTVYIICFLAYFSPVVLLPLVHLFSLEFIPWLMVSLLVLCNSLVTPSAFVCKSWGITNQGLGTLVFVLGCVPFATLGPIFSLTCHPRDELVVTTEP